jgi:hypothetical protein
MHSATGTWELHSGAHFHVVSDALAVDRVSKKNRQSLKITFSFLTLTRYLQLFAVAAVM